MILKYRLYLLIVLILFIIAIMILMPDNSSTIRDKEGNFAVSDISSVTRIHIGQQENNEINLVRNEGFWTLNDKYLARPEAVIALLQAVQVIDIKSPVSKVEHGFIMDSLNNRSALIEIFDGSKIIKKYHIFQEKGQLNRTFMLLEKSSQPFVVFIPGFTERIGSIFSIDELYWRDKIIFHLTPAQIESVTVEHPASPEKSYRIKRVDNNRYVIESLLLNEPVSGYDTSAIISYLYNFVNIRFESFTSITADKKIQSIIKSTPLFIITIEDKYSNTNSLKAFSVPVDNADNFQQQQEFDPDKMYAVFNENRDTVIIKYFVFDPLIKEIKYFLLN